MDGCCLSPQKRFLVVIFLLTREPFKRTPSLNTKGKDLLGSLVLNLEMVQVHRNFLFRFGKCVRLLLCWNLLAIGHGYGLRTIYSLGGDAGNNEQIGNADEEEFIFIVK